MFVYFQFLIFILYALSHRILARISVFGRVLKNVGCTTASAIGTSILGGAKKQNAFDFVNPLAWLHFRL